MTTLRTWADQCFRIIDESGARVERVRLVIEEDDWHTWEHDELKDDWADSAQRLLDGVSLELPRGKLTATFLALGPDGDIRSRLNRSIVGRGEPRQKNNDFSALAQSMDAQARTMRALLEAMTEQMERSAAAQLKLMEHNQLLQEQLIEVRAETSSDVVSAMIAEHIGPQLGPILDLLPDVMRAYASGRGGNLKLVGKG